MKALELIGALALAFLLAGCGKGSHSGGMENPSPAVKAKGQLDGSVEATSGP